MSRKIARDALVGLSLIGGLAILPVSALASAMASTDMTLSWYTWYDVDGSGSYNTGDTLVDTSAVALETSWGYSSSHWPYPGTLVSASDNGNDVAVDSSLNVSRSFSGGTASGNGSITGSNGASGLEVSLHAESQVNGGLAGADWENLSQSASVYNFHFEPGNLIGTTNPDDPLYITLVADYSITSSRDCTPPHCYSGGSINLEYFQYGSWRDDNFGYHFYSTGPSPTSLVSIPGAYSAANVEEFSILLAPFYEPGGALTTYTGINVSAEVYASAQYPGGPAEPPQPSVPEPSTIALMGLGLVGIGIARRRRHV